MALWDHHEPGLARIQSMCFLCAASVMEDDIQQRTVNV